MTSFHVALFADETLTSNNTFAESASLSIYLPAGSYSFTFTSPVTRSSAHGGAIGVSTSAPISISFVGQSTTPYSNNDVILNDSVNVNSGGNIGFVYDAPTTGKQFEQAAGIITCAAATTLKIGVYSSINQDITLGKGTSFSLVK